MQDLSPEMAKAIRRFEPIETEGLTLYPICVKEINEFTTARPAIEFMQQSLPVALLSKPLLQAYYQMELDAAANGQPGSGLFYKSILFLLLALRAGEGLTAEKRMELVEFEPNESNPMRLKSVLIFVGGEVKRITPMQFQRLRPILAAQNGIDLVSENANPELGAGGTRPCGDECTQTDLRRESTESDNRDGLRRRRVGNGKLADLEADVQT